MATAQKTQAAGAAGAASAPAPIDPPERLLMGPGPSNPDPRVLEAMTANPVGHLDPYFVKVMDETMDALRKVYRTTNHHTIPISATGSAGLESITLNLLEPGDEAIVVVNGYFGARLAEMARRAGANVRVLESPPGEVADPAAVDKLLREKAANLVAFVHVETTTGARQPIEPMVEVARKHGALVAMDCVTSLGGLPLDIDTLGVDAAGSCSQKCIGAPPGLAPITVGPRAMAKVRARKGQAADLVLRLRVALSVLGRGKRVAHARVPPHRAHREYLRLSRSAADRSRGRTRRAPRAARVGARRVGARPRAPRPVALHAGRESLRDDQPGFGARPESTKPSSVAGCSTWASRWAAASAHWPAKCGASA